MADWLVIDLETGIHNRGEGKIGNNKASPHHPENKVIWVGVKHKCEKRVIQLNESYYTMTSWSKGDASSRYVYVGQNLKFDLLYLMKEVPYFRDEIWPQLGIWDTALAEYLLTGQEHLYPSLDELSKKYGGTIKNSLLKEMWDKGIDTEDIAREHIEPYLDDDLENTALVFQAQLAQVKARNLMPLIASQMRALKATTEMEWNGMHFNRSAAIGEGYRLQKTCNALELALQTAMVSSFPSEYTPQPSSPKDVGLYLFGGKVYVKEDKEQFDDDGVVLRYKSGKRIGQVKTKKELVEHEVIGITTPEPEWRNKTGWTVDEDVLNVLINTGAGWWPSDLLKYRELSKLASTYFVGYTNLTWPHDNCIHQNLNHVGTPTGRLTCTNPNLQNVKRSEDD